MTLRKLAWSLLAAAGVTGVLAAPAGAATVTIAPATGDGRQINCYPFATSDWEPNAGFVYKNVPAFTLAPGDQIAFDTWRTNDADIGFDVSLAATTTDGGDEPAQAVTQVVGNTQVPLVPRGNTVVGDYELQFSSTSSFTFPGGGLVIRFSNPAATLAADTGCSGSDGNLVGAADSTDASGFFVKRFFIDGDGVFPWAPADTNFLAAFRIVNAPPASDGTGGSAGGGGAGGGAGAGGGPSPTPDRTSPVVSNVSISPAAKTVSFRLSEASSVRLRVQRRPRGHGRLAHGRCVRSTAIIRSRRPLCNLWVKASGLITRAGKRGANTFTFPRRIGGRVLRPAHYRLNLRATDRAGNQSGVARGGFRIRP